MSSDDFTERQRQVIALVARGYSAKEIAQALGIRPRTARAHTDVLRVKLGVESVRRLPAAYRSATGDDPLESVERLGTKADMS